MSRWPSPHHPAAEFVSQILCGIKVWWILQPGHGVYVFLFWKVMCHTGSCIVMLKNPQFSTPIHERHNTQLEHLINILVCSHAPVDEDDGVWWFEEIPAHTMTLTLPHLLYCKMQLAAWLFLFLHQTHFLPSAIERQMHASWKKLHAFPPLKGPSLVLLSPSEAVLMVSGVQKGPLQEHLQVSKHFQGRYLSVYTNEISVGANCDSCSTWCREQLVMEMGLVNVKILPDWLYFGPFGARTAFPWASFCKSLLQGTYSLLWTSKYECNLLGRHACLQYPNGTLSLGLG